MVGSKFRRRYCPDFEFKSLGYGLSRLDFVIFVFYYRRRGIFADRRWRNFGIITSRTSRLDVFYGKNFIRVRLVGRTYVGVCRFDVRNAAATRPRRAFAVDPFESNGFCRDFEIKISCIFVFGIFGVFRIRLALESYFIIYQRLGERSLNFISAGIGHTLRVFQNNFVRIIPCQLV